jgi:hypothetical protein
MSPPPNGIGADVIREIMPPYRLSADLLQVAFAASPRPPDAIPTWRHTRITRLIEEIVAPKPADAGQARIAALILILREPADTITTHAHALEQTIEQVCRLAGAASPAPRGAATRPGPPADRPGATLPVADAGRSAAVTPASPSADRTPIAAPGQCDRSANPAALPNRDLARRATPLAGFGAEP